MTTGRFAVRYAEGMPNFEKLDAYRVSIELTELAFRISDSLPRGYNSLADQLRRAAMSVPLEGLYERVA